MVIIMIQVSNTWSRNAINAMFGFGIDGYSENPYYTIGKDIPGLDSDTYGSLVGFYYSLTYAPCLLFMGHLTSVLNRKLMVGFACIMWGVFTYLNAHAETVF